MWLPGAEDCTACAEALHFLPLPFFNLISFTINPNIFSLFAPHVLDIYTT